MKGLRFADAQESRFQAGRRSDFGIVVMKGLLFADTQETCLESWKSSHTGCAALLCRQFADDQVSCIHAANHSKMGNAVPPVFNLSMLRNRVFRLGDVQISALSS